MAGVDAAAEAREAFHRSLPAKRMAAGVIFRDQSGNVLLVDPVYKEPWEVPGGIVEADESPHQAAVREVREELGFECDPMRLWCVDWRTGNVPLLDAMMFLFDGGTVTDEQTRSIVLPDDELRAWAFVAPAELPDRLPPRLARRVASCLEQPGATLYMEDGVPHA